MNRIHGRIRTRWVKAILTLGLALSIQSVVLAAGFKTIIADDLKIGVFYPSDAPEEEVRLGPFDARLAVGASFSYPRKVPVILFSHGNNGRIRNYHLTSKALADAGFVVVSPLHTVDHLLAGTTIYQAFNWRNVELRRALEAVIQEQEFRHNIDFNHIHAIGHSIGALTALSAAGAGADGYAFEKHCVTNNDPAVCVQPTAAQLQQIQKLRGVVTPQLSRDIPKRYFGLPYVNGAVALIAPVGQGVVIDTNIFSARKVLIVGLKGDTVTQVTWHASHLAAIIPPDLLEEYSLRDGHHSAFISPFAVRATSRENIPAAYDPPGFNRLDFINQLNSDLIAFFRKYSR